MQFPRCECCGGELDSTDTYCRECRYDHEDFELMVLVEIAPGMWAMVPAAMFLEAVETSGRMEWLHRYGMANLMQNDPPMYWLWGAQEAHWRAVCRLNRIGVPWAPGRMWPYFAASADPMLNPDNYQDPAVQAMVVAGTVQRQRAVLN